jgi:RHS repeat-associated protein
VTYPSGRGTTYDRNSLGKISQVTASGIAIPLASNLTYRPFGGPLGFPNGFGGTVNNVAGECDCLTVSNPGQPRERTYGYDPNRNLTSVTGTNTPWYSQTFGYDQLNRLTSAAGRYGSIAYTYDDVGNRLTRYTDGTIETYTYFPGTNSLEQITGGTNPRTFAYDPNGNITSDGTLTFIYDQSNQLTEVEQGANSLAEYAYNGLGQRVIKQVGANTTVYHYDLDGKLIAESLLDGAMTREYLYMGKVRIAMVDVAGGNALYHFLNDRLGTPEILTDASGTVAWEAWYEPFGEAHTHPSSSVVNNIRPPGQYYDSETRLHYNYNRYYDPSTGRYLTPDPSGLDAGVNLYVYVWNNPVLSVDPLGLLGFGAELSGSVERGVIAAGFGTTGSLGGGVFFNSFSPSVGGFASGGIFAGGPGWGMSVPSLPSKSNWVFGYYSGAGVNAFVTNANDVSELSGPFKTYSFNLAFGFRAFSVQFSIGKSKTGRTIGVLSYGGPMGLGFPTGVGFGLSLSKYNTNTLTTSGGGGSPCE